jgi:hypothetical protein
VPAETDHRKPSLGQICRWCVADGVPRRSVMVAIVVGTILNLINQGDVLFGTARPNVAKFLLTFVVPYFVATYGAVSFRLSSKERAD